MANRELFENVKSVLQYRGHVRWANALRVVSEYDDGRMLISGMFPFNLHDENAPFFQSIAVLLYLPTDDEEMGQLERPQFQFALPPKTDKEPSTKTETIVYFWENNATFYYRPGLWEQHLASIVAGIREGFLKKEKRNNVPVGDDKLFPEYS